MKRPVITIMDRYILRHLMGGYVAVLLTLVAMLSLENISRLSAAIVETDTPFTLLAYMLTALVPEYLGIAIPVATYLSMALAVRRLSVNGEWQIFTSIGLRPTRVMALPMALALGSAGAQLAIRMDLQPIGEHAFDQLLGEISAGVHGMPLRDLVAVDAHTTFVTDPSAGRARGTLNNVMIRRGGDVASAPTATASRDPSGAIILTLRNGVLIHPRPGGGYDTLAFARYHMRLAPERGRGATATEAERLDRVSAANLLPRINQEAARPGVPAPATAAFLSKIQSAALCLMLPWLGMALGVPPKRQAGGASIFIGLALIVVNLRSTAFVEEHFTIHPVPAALLHALLWVTIVAAISELAQRHGPGSIDQLLNKALRYARALSAKPLTVAPALHSAAASARESRWSLFSGEEGGIQTNSAVRPSGAGNSAALSGATLVGS